MSEKEEIKKVTKDLEWKDISHEICREYTFMNGEHVHCLYIQNPVKLNVSKSGGHRILDKQNIAHYIPSGWIHLKWKTNDDCAFRF